MGNRELQKISIASSVLLDEIRNHGYSIKEISRLVDRSDRTIRTYLQKREMPIQLFNDIMNILYPKSKTVWVTLTTIPIQDEHLFDIMERSYSKRKKAFKDCELFEDDILTIFNGMLPKDTEGYISAGCMEHYKDWFMKKKEEMKHV